MCDVQKLNFSVTDLTFGLKAKNLKFINYSLVETAHARCVWLLWKKPFNCPTSFPGYLGSGERETLGTKLANVEHLNHNSTLFRATRKNIIFNFWSLMCRPLYMNSIVFNIEKNTYIFFLTKKNYITLITAILLTSRLHKITYSTVTSIATTLTFFVFYKYVRYSAIQYLKHTSWRATKQNNYIF